MGAELPMLRSRQKPGACPVEGHGPDCDMSAERRFRERRDEKREWRADALSDCPVCGWEDHHTILADGRHECGWCETRWETPST